MKVGRPVKTSRRSTEEELKIANINWNTAELMATDRVCWHSIVEAVALQGAKRNKYEQTWVQKEVDWTYWYRMAGTRGGK